MKTVLLPLLATTLLLAGCGEQAAAEKAAAAPAESAAPAAPEPAVPAEAASTAAPAAGWRRIRITGYTCGDNCYLEFTADDSDETEAPICTAPQCAPWFDAQAIPASELGRNYDVRMRTSEQVDGAGQVMDSEFPTIIEMRPVG